MVSEFGGRTSALSVVTIPQLARWKEKTFITPYYPQQVCACNEGIGALVDGHMQDGAVDIAKKTNFNLSVCPRTDRLGVELRRLAEDSRAYADALLVRLGSLHSRASGGEIATRRGENLADTRATVVTVVCVGAARR